MAAASEEVTNQFFKALDDLINKESVKIEDTQEFYNKTAEEVPFLYI